MDAIRTSTTPGRRPLQARATLPRMRRGSLTVVAVVVVAAVLLGPQAMALDGCAVLGMCDGPCGLTCAAVFAGPTPVRLQSIADTPPIVTGSVLPTALSTLEPPPKVSVLSL